MCDVSEDKEKPAESKVGGDIMTVLPLKTVMFLPQSRSFLSKSLEPFHLITSLLYAIFLCQLLRPPQVAPEVKNLPANAGEM